MYTVNLLQKLRQNLICYQTIKLNQRLSSLSYQTVLKFCDKLKREEIEKIHTGI